MVEDLKKKLTKEFPREDLNKIRDQALKGKPNNLSYQTYKQFWAFAYKSPLSAPQLALILAMLEDLWLMSTNNNSSKFKSGDKTPYPSNFHLSNTGLGTGLEGKLINGTTESTASNSTPMPTNEILAAIQAIDTKIDSKFEVVNSKFEAVNSEMNSMQSEINAIKSGAFNSNANPFTSFFTSLANAFGFVPANSINNSSDSNQQSSTYSNMQPSTNLAREAELLNIVKGLSSEIKDMDSRVNTKIDGMLNSIRDEVKNDRTRAYFKSYAPIDRELINNNMTDATYHPSNDEMMNLSNLSEIARDRGDHELSKRLLALSRSAGAVPVNLTFSSEELNGEFNINGNSLIYTLPLPGPISLAEVIELMWQKLYKSPELSDALKITGQLQTLFAVKFVDQQNEGIIYLNNALNITKATTHKDYIKHWNEKIGHFENQGYASNDVVVAIMRLTPIKKTKSHLQISKIKPATQVNTKTGSLDLETVTLTEGGNAGKLIVYAGGLRLTGGENKLLYLTDYPDYLTKPWEASRQLLLDLCRLLLECEGYTIYVHNLGGFDGVYLLKPLVELLGEDLKLLMDSSKKTICFTLPNCVIKDSYRIFPTSLAALSKMFNVPVPKGEFDHKSVNLTNLEAKRVELEEYLGKDLISLLDVMNAAGKNLFEKYGIDLSSAYSAASLAMKMYRTKFIPHNIPILPRWLEKEIRKGYRGGATQVFKNKGTNLRYYDVNSLYPTAMMNPVPLDYYGTINSVVNHEDYYGFIDANIYLEPGGCIPVLQHSVRGGKLEYPTGQFRGVYYSEELKQLAKLGYLYQINKVYLFNKGCIFDDYVNHFYNTKLELDRTLNELKAQLKTLKALKEIRDLNEVEQVEIKRLEIEINVIQGQRFLVKLFLNGLYGYFGRSPDNPNTLVVKGATLLSLREESNNITGEINLTKEYSLVTTSANDVELPTKANVAIAGAITGGSRMIVNPYKTDPDFGVHYSDTDSMFCTKALDPALLGLELGQWKDELDGEIIKEATFLAPKQYGYVTESGKSKCVIAGFERGSMTYNELVNVGRGGAIAREREVWSKNFEEGCVMIRGLKRTLKKKTEGETLN